MHPRNPYRTPIDFVALSEQYPPLKPYVKHFDKGPANIDYKDADAQRHLTEALLSRDFSLVLTLPRDRLCPPVPNRLNYILWLHDIIEESYRTLPHCDQVLGLDVGIGASAIYPLLGCRLHPSWGFVGTEIDPLSFEYAIKNAEMNNLQGRISIVKTSSSDPLYAQLFSNHGKPFAFTMCNPPFYSSVEEVTSSAESKLFGPSAVCTGAEVEMITTGGEETFVSRMVDESLDTLMRHRCIWFTSMVGKLSSVGAIVSKFQVHQIDNYAVTELIQGQTRRWVVAWSFTDVRLPDFLARSLPPIHRTVLPQHNTLSLTLSSHNVPHASTLLKIFTQVIEVLDDVVLDRHATVQTEYAEGDGASSTKEGGTFTLRASAARNTWSRAARRSQGKQMNVQGVYAAEETTGTSSGLVQGAYSVEDPVTTSIYPVSVGPAMIVEIRVYHDPALTPPRHKRKMTGRPSQAWVLECTWRRGYERSLFESFWSYVSRKVTAVLKAQDDASAPI